jgi:hypothetical protein
MSEDYFTLTRLYQEIISLKQRPGTRLLIQKLQQKIDEIERQASDKQATNKTS